MPIVNDNHYIPSLPNHITLLALMLRMTSVERNIVRAAESTDDDVGDLLFLFGNARYIDLDRPETIQGIQMLETKGYLTLGRSVDILSTTIQDIERPS